MAGNRDRPAERIIEDPWYSDGLRFSCSPECNACCISHGEYEYVYLQSTDIPRLAALLGQGTLEFLGNYTFRENGWTVLRMDEPSCPFLEGLRCSVYEARPIQCRTFPFWHEFLESRDSWLALKDFCPGIDRGRRFSLEYIREQLERRKI